MRWGGKPADDLAVYYNTTLPGLEEMRCYALDFATDNDATPFSYEMQPAEVSIDIAHAPAVPWVGVMAGNGDVGFARADVPLTAGAGVASVLPMTNSTTSLLSATTQQAIPSPRRSGSARRWA
jgi:hypothetical protein